METDRLGRLLNLWTQETRALPTDKAKDYFKSQRPLDAMAGLRALFGNEQYHPERLLRFLQLGNEIQGELGNGKDDQVMQLIAALLQKVGGAPHGTARQVIDGK